MSPGKLAAQVAHAAVEAARISDSKMIDAWNSGGHYTKIILLAEDEAQITNIDTYLRERGFRTAPIIDEGRTEIKPFSKTALGVEVVDKAIDHVADTFSSFRTYKEDPDDKLTQQVKFGYEIAEAAGHLNRKGTKALSHM